MDTQYFLFLSITREWTEPAVKLVRDLPVIPLGHLSLDGARNQAESFSQSLWDTYIGNDASHVSTTVIWRLASFRPGNTLEAYAHGSMTR